LDAVEDDVRILLITNPGERPVQVDFGTPIRRLLFEQQGPDLEVSIEEAIRSALATWLPFVNLLSINIETNNTNSNILPNEVNVSLRIGIANTELERVITQRIRS